MKGHIEAFMKLREELERTLLAPPELVLWTPFRQTWPSIWPFWVIILMTHLPWSNGWQIHSFKAGELMTKVDSAKQRSEPMSFIPIVQTWKSVARCPDRNLTDFSRVWSGSGTDCSLPGLCMGWVRKASWISRLGSVQANLFSVRTGFPLRNFPKKIGREVI